MTTVTAAKEVWLLDNIPSFGGCALVAVLYTWCALSPVKLLPSPLLSLESWLLSSCVVTGTFEGLVDWFH